MPAHPAANPVLPFEPSSPAAAEALIQAFHDPDLSLADLARTHHTTIEALTLWLTEADTRQRLTALDSAACWRTRHIANAHLTKAITALLSVIKHNPIEPDQAWAGPPDASTLDFRAELLRCRRIESVRKAAAALIRLTRHRPLSPLSQPVEPATGAASSTPRAAAPAPTTPPPPTPASPAPEPQLHTLAVSPSPAPSPTPTAPTPTDPDADIPPHLIEALIALVNQTNASPAPTAPAPTIATTPFAQFQTPFAFTAPTRRRALSASGP